MSAPAVSVVVPVFNESVAILETGLSSIQAQTMPDFECLVIDESTDVRTSDTAQAFCAIDSRFRYLRPQNRIGLAASLNLGIAQARADLIARFDADDICAPDRLAKQVAFLSKHPNVDVVGGALALINSEGTFIAYRNYPLEHRTIARSMQITTAVAHPTVMFRRALVTAAGVYEPSFRFAEDLDLWLRWLNYGASFANLPDVLVRYRMRNGTRQKAHWRYNLRARIRNFTGRLMLWRLAGVVVCTGAILVPARLHRSILSLLQSQQAHAGGHAT